FTFTTTVTQADAASVWLVFDIRNTTIYGQSLKMDCGVEPDFSDPAGVECSLTLRLGPAPYYDYHYEVLSSADDSGDKLSESLVIEGPRIYLLNGPNMLGIPKDVSGSMAGFLDNLGTGESSVFSWQSGGLRDKHNKGEFVARDNAYIPTPGEGYFVISESENQTLPTPLNDYPEITTSTTSLDLQPGWNIISNPYSKPVRLKDLQIAKDSEAPVGWMDAASNGWVFNGIYYFKGTDWGSEYAFESAGSTQEAELIPWLGYWMYFKINDSSVYKLIFTKP
ncbi:MAG: hypothetical protein P1P81_11840, partial [Desulfobulbales bacterium]|nr:hypothetical protein [Desulfobulbales bacterium]